MGLTDSGSLSKEVPSLNLMESDSSYKRKLGLLRETSKPLKCIDSSFTETVLKSELTDGTNGSLYNGRILIKEQYVKAQFTSFLDIPRLPKPQQTHFRGVGASPGFQVSKDGVGFRHRSNQQGEESFRFDFFEALLFMAEIVVIYSRSFRRYSGVSMRAIQCCGVDE
ncbi:uncharacterized protein LOC117127365 [Brassica rapa]|uniref:uncharacterized protein LOC117127365 n=1 Tax=Brassica campestris TaxID=3711 RepID=UPI00142E8984|nr:uncharacterized protein LOC117127365 [Brassica rapa]